MGYVLLWIESLTFSLLLVATLTACIARLRRPILRRVLWILVAFVPWLVYAGLTGFTAYLKYWLLVGDSWFYPCVGLVVCFSLGAIFIRRGLRKPKDSPAAASWPRAGLAVALAVVTALHMMTYWNLDLAVSQRMAGLRADAGRLALSVAPPLVADRDNAALIYERAFEVVPEQDSWPKDWDDKWREWLSGENKDFDPQDAALRSFLEQRESALVLVCQAAERPGCHFGRDYGHPSIDVRLPELRYLRDAARLLALDARCKLADGDVRGAMQNVNAMFTIAEHIGSDPMLIPLLVSIAIDSMATETLQAILAAGPHNADDLDAVDIDDWLSYRKRLERAYRMEQAFGQSIFCDMADNWPLGLLDDAWDTLGDKASGNLSAAASLYRVFLWDEDVAVHRRIMGRLRQSALRPYYQAKDDLTALEDQMRTGPRGLLAGMIFPALARVSEVVAKTEARHHVTRLAMALARYQAAGGRYPEKLDDLVPEFLTVVPTDPFDGKPIRYDPTERSPVVYSIGPDGIDDGGGPMDEKKEEGDIRLVLPRAAEE